MKQKLFVEIAICGAPNAGKSTFLNAMLKRKQSIVSSKIQTTRVPTLGTFENDEILINFIDSPGAFRARKGYSLEKAISKQAWGVLTASENIILFVDGTRGICQNTQYIIQAIQKGKEEEGKKAIAVITKVDLTSTQKKLELAKELDETAAFEEIYMISSRSGAGMENLMSYFKSIATPEDVSELSFDDARDDKKNFMSEITREIIFENLAKELPYSCNIVTNSIEEDDAKIVVNQDIFVTRESHKIILIGKKGNQIKEIGALAIDELEKIYGKEVFLTLECKIDERWRENFEHEILG